MTARDSVTLALPREAAPREHDGFMRLCRHLSTLPAGLERDAAETIEAAGLHDLYHQPVLDAAARCAVDLVAQGWTVRVDGEAVTFWPPGRETDRDLEKQRIRAQELISRDEQLRTSSVRRFIRRMESPHEHRGRLVSVFDLMRDGQELLDAMGEATPAQPAIMPYVQIVDDATCELTGFKLHDIWRYFRHTWSTAYRTVPGRSMPVLVRDAATPDHAVIGIAAISSPVVQIAERDLWIGWESDEFLRAVDNNPSDDVARWVARRLLDQKSEIFTDDLVEDGVIESREIDAPTSASIESLNADAERHRLRHHRSATTREHRAIAPDDWATRARTDLFRGKRSAALAEALDADLHIRPLLGQTPSANGLQAVLADRAARSRLRRLVRRARGERVGTVVADLTVCGAVAPYSALAAGKLVGALAVSPTVIRAYEHKYSRPSEIASAMAGHAVLRESRLALITTTSLYGSGSSQYNRLRWPAAVMGGPDGERVSFEELGRSRSFGTSHFTDATVSALMRVASLGTTSVRVNSLFGEGVSPRLRKVRLGLAALGWPTNDLLKHGRPRILYGVPLVENLLAYSLGIDAEPQYRVDTTLDDADAQVGRWWLNRWAIARSQQPRVRESIASNSLALPVNHAARVRLPTVDDELGLDGAGR